MIKIEKVPILPVAKIFCALHTVVGIILGVIVTVGSMVVQDDDGFWSLGPWALLVFPVVNAGLGLLTGAFLAWGYNLFAEKLGGIEIEAEIKDNSVKLIADIQETAKA